MNADWNDLAVDWNDLGWGWNGDAIGQEVSLPLSGAAVAHALASGALSGGSQAAFVALGQSARIGAQKMDPSHRRPGADSVFVRARRPGGRYLSIGKRRIQ